MDMQSARARMAAAFTLVELLVVIAVVAILIALLVPVLFTGTYAVARGKSVSSLRNMGGALLSYASDHGGKLPEGAFNPTLHGQTQRYWHYVLDFYISEKRYDPKEESGRELPQWQNDPLKVFATPAYDSGYDVSAAFGWNHSYFGYTPSWYPERMGWGSSLSDVDSPSRTIIIGTSRDTTDRTLENLLIYPQEQHCARRYNGKGLYLHVDGHVDSYSPEQITANGNYLFLMKKP